MRYVMKQKLFAWAGNFNIRDAEGRDVFVVDRGDFSFGGQLSFRDLDGRELAFIRQKHFTWGPTYEIWRDGVLAAVVKKELFTLVYCRFTVDVPGPDDLEATGDFMEHEYTFTRGGRAVAVASRQWFTWTDTYGVDIAEGEDDVLLLASTVVIDIASHHR